MAILSNNMHSKAVKKLEALNRRLAKAGKETITWSEKEVFLPAYVVWPSHYNEIEHRDLMVPMTEMTFSQKNAVVVDGWNFLGVVDHINDTIFQIDETVNLEPFRYRAFCDHCNSKRVRNKTIILRNASGELKQVGTNCIKDFVGINLDSLVHMIISLDGHKYLDDPDFLPFSFGSHEFHFELPEVLNVALKTITNHGFSSRSHAEPGKDSASLIWKILFREIPVGDAKAIGNADDCISWVKNINDFSSFWMNAKAVFRNGMVSHKTIGIVAAAVFFYIKSKEQEMVASNSVSEHFGIPGMRLNLNLSKISTKNMYIDTSYYEGTMYIHTFQDDDGNIFVWKTTSNSLLGFSDNEKVKVRCTIKEHNEYRGIKQTVLTRCKVEAI